MEFLCLGFSKTQVGCRKKIKDHEGTDSLERSGRVLFNDSAADIAGVGFKTEPTTRIILAECDSANQGSAQVSGTDLRYEWKPQP